jgi:hypothetical protein
MNTTFSDTTAGIDAGSLVRISGPGRTASLRSPFGILPAPAYGQGRADSLRAESPEDLFAQLWSPGLLDRLHEPLTRYRE